MTIAELQELVKAYGLTVDDFHGGAGKFRDVYIGIGQPYSNLIALRGALCARNVEAKLARVDNEGHPDYGKQMVEVNSFWWD